MAKWEIKSAEDYRRAWKTIREKMDELSDALANAPAKALTDIALDCLSRAVQRAPVKLGDLRASGYVEVNQALVASGNKSGGIDIKQAVTAEDGTVMTIEARIGFTAKYAWVQHEHVEFDHPEGGQAKFLESVVIESSGRWKAYIKKQIEAAIKEALNE